MYIYNRVSDIFAIHYMPMFIYYYYYSCRIIIMRFCASPKRREKAVVQKKIATATANANV